MEKIGNRFCPRKLLTEYTNSELKEFLDNNEIENAMTLTYVCAEILRRAFPLEITHPLKND